MKVAIGFFGITRSLKYTINSINIHILNVLKSNNINYDIFLHCYALSSYSNKRTNEKIKKKDINNNEYKLLKPKYFKQHNQDKIKKKLNLKSYRTHKDPWKTNYNSVDNFILASYSKYILTKMIKKKIKNYDYILYIRPDCFYTQKFDINYFKLIKNNNTIIIPNFHLYGTYKINDRFAITNKKTFKIYGSVFKKLLDLSKKKSLHSETIIGIILKNNKINIKRINFLFCRIRFNGIICKRDEKFYKKNLKNLKKKKLILNKI